MDAAAASSKPYLLRQSNFGYCFGCVDRVQNLLEPLQVSVGDCGLRVCCCCAGSSCNVMQSECSSGRGCEIVRQCYVCSFTGAKCSAFLCGIFGACNGWHAGNGQRAYQPVEEGGNVGLLAAAVSTQDDGGEVRRVDTHDLSAGANQPKLRCAFALHTVSM